jgi:DegV family protein with EDD domain
MITALRAYNNNMTNCIFVIDSASSYDLEFLKNNNVVLLPLSIINNAGRAFADDGCDITQETIIKELNATNTFTTSSTVLGMLMDKFEELSARYEKVIYIPISSGLSGQVNQVKMIQRQFPNILIVNTVGAASLNEFLLLDGLELAKKNMQAEAIVTELERVQKNMVIMFSVEFVDYLIKSGRVTKPLVSLVKALHIKPILHLYDKNHLCGCGRKYTTVFPKLIAKIKKCYTSTINSNNIKHISLLTTAGETQEKTDFLLNSITSAFNILKSRILIHRVPNCVVCHTSGGAYGLAIETTMPHKTFKFDSDN